MATKVVLLLKPLDNAFTKILPAALGAANLSFGCVGYFVIKEVAKHGAVLVDGNLYQYEKGGLDIVSGSSAIEAADQFNERYTCWSQKSLVEFVEWVNSVNVTNKFSKDNYRVGSNNCIHFVHDACVFLQVELPFAFKKVFWFCQVSAGSLDDLHSVLQGSSSSSSSSGSCAIA